MKSWKTTLFGAMLAGALGIGSAAQAGIQLPVALVNYSGLAAAVSAALLGFFSKDKGTTGAQ